VLSTLKQFDLFASTSLINTYNDAVCVPSDYEFQNCISVFILKSYVVPLWTPFPQ